MILQAGVQPSTINRSSNLLLPSRPSELPKIPIFPTFPCHQARPNKIKHEPLKISASYSSPTPKASILENSIDRDQTKEKRGVEVKQIEKPRLVLKFIWMEKNIGIALDQAIAGGYGTVPMSPYYFWPRTDAWEELKVLLESKPWISQKRMVVLLNQATDVINLWQQSGGNLSL